MAVLEWVEWLAAVLVVVGAFFVLTAALGAARLPDFFSRANVSTVATTQGLLSTALASTIFLSVQGGALYLKDLLIFLFVFLTVPAGAHLLARAAYYLGVPMAEQTVIDELRGQRARLAPKLEPPPEGSEGLAPEGLAREGLARGPADARN